MTKLIFKYSIKKNQKGHKGESKKIKKEKEKIPM